MLRSHRRGGSRPPILIPPPVIRPWRGKPQRPHALLTMATGDHGRDLLEISGPILRRYAERYDLDFHVLRGRIHLPYACAGKWRASAYLPRCERCVWIDADTILAPDMPNLLELVPAGSIGVYNELPHIPSKAWFADGRRRLARSQGWQDPPVVEIAWNSGVWVADREHAEVFRPAARPFPKDHCVEQWHEQLVAERLGIPVFRLPEGFNYQWWPRKPRPMVEPVPGVWIYHWSGCFDSPTRLGQMRAMRSALYPSL